jgi:hypothetical protein
MAALVAMRIQGANRRDAARPEIVVTGWKRSTRTVAGRSVDSLQFDSIRNVGKGPALHVQVNCVDAAGSPGPAWMASLRVAIIATNEVQTVSGEITLHWDRPDHKYPNPKMISVSLRILAWDTLSYRHETLYKLVAVPQDLPGGFDEEVADGVMLLQRLTTTRPVWLLKLKARIGRRAPYELR